MSYNQIKNIAKLLITSLLVTLFLLFYCQAFYDFGIDAKNRILHSSLYAFFTTPLLFWASAYLCRRFAPAACGSNMDNIKSEKNLNLRTVFVCAVSSLIATFAGGSLGREGPSAQMSASIFYTISKKISWIYIGTGVGLAVAFNAPIAGFICVCEKLWQS
ncbi:MAG: hypothetical protein FJX34_04705, partial [Alphaproteobacteria bacterium]|nr:hypothetical protein [Alphaproteobacteria bacterium]